MALTKDQVKKSPGIDTDKPVSRQQEREYHRYYGYPRYWAYAGRWGMGAFPGLLADPQKVDVPNDEANGTNDSIDTDDVHLRSASELRVYYIHGSDESIGHIEDFIVDDETWQVCYLVVDTSNWWMGKKVLVAPHWASKVNWAQHQIEIDLSRDTIKNGPEWDPDAAVNREYETRLYDYYGRPAYWK